jgi:signal peptidase I
MLRNLMKEALIPIAVAIALAFLIQAAVAKPYEIPTPSMEPTIQVNDRVIANRLIYKVRDIRRGDIVVFQPTAAARESCPGSGSPDVPFVKRVIGLPGDRVTVQQGHRDVIVNGRPLDVQNARLNPAQGITGSLAERTFQVPPGKIFVLGDNRPASCDSHQWSDPYVPKANVIGQAEVTYWPLRHIKFLD